MSMTREPPSERLLAYLDGQLEPAEARAMAAYLENSARGRQRVEELRAMTDTLAELDPILADLDLVADVRAAVASEQVTTRPGRWRWGVAALAACLAVALVAPLLVGLQERGSGSAVPNQVDELGFRSKGVADTEARKANRWLGIQLFRVRGKEPPVRVDRRLRRDDGLLVAYTNLGPQPYTHLMVFAVDATGRVHWLYPAFERAGDDPQAIPIEGGAAAVELPDLIRHPFAKGTLVLQALFLRRPAQVSQIEGLLRDGVQQREPGDEAAGRLPLDGAGQQRLRLEVQ
jgi:hypothetical protein